MGLAAPVPDIQIDGFTAFTIANIVYFAGGASYQEDPIPAGLFNP